MAFGDVTGEKEYFTVAQLAEAFGEPEEVIIQEIEEMKEELQILDKNVEDYVMEVKPESIQRFIILPGGLKQ